MTQDTSGPTTAARFALTPAEIASLLSRSTRNSLEEDTAFAERVQQLLREKMDVVFAAVSDYVESHALLEKRFSDALRAQRERDLAQAMFPRVGAEAVVEIETRAAVLQWVLEMLPSPAPLTADPEFEEQPLNQTSGMTLDHDLDGLIASQDESELVRRLALRSSPTLMLSYSAGQR